MLVKNEVEKKGSGKDSRVFVDAMMTLFEGLVKNPDAVLPDDDAFGPYRDPLPGEGYDPEDEIRGKIPERKYPKKES